MPLQDSNIAGLLVILFSLVTYRFGSKFKCILHGDDEVTVTKIAMQMMRMRVSYSLLVQSYHSHQMESEDMLDRCELELEERAQNMKNFI